MSEIFAATQARRQGKRHSHVAAAWRTLMRIQSLESEPDNRVCSSWLFCWHEMLSVAKRLFAGLRSHLERLPGAGGEVVDIGGIKVRLGERVAEGGFAFVHVARNLSDSRVTFALKRITCHEDADLADAMAEMELLARLPPHPNIIRYRSGTHRPKSYGREGGGLVATEVLLLTDYYDRGCLKSACDQLFDRGQTLDGSGLLSLFSQACAAVAHLHSQSPPIAHRDVKLENLLLQGGDLRQIASGHGRLVLCDFGSATTRAQAYEARRELLEEEERIQKTTTLAYRAPEMIDLYQRKVVNEKVDVWALGVLLYTMAFSKFPFDPLAPLAILNGQYRLPRSLGQRFDLVLQSCLTTDPDVRSSIFGIQDALKNGLSSSAC